METNVVALLAVTIAWEQVGADILTQLICAGAGGCNGGTIDTDGDGIADPDDTLANSIGVGSDVNRWRYVGWISRVLETS